MGQKQEISEHAIILTPTVLARAVVARATDNRPTSGIDVSGTTELSQGNVSKLLAGMRGSGEADTGYYHQAAESGRAVVPIVGTDVLRESVAGDVHLQRAVGILEFAERRGLTPGAAFDELLKIGNMVLEASDPSAQAPGASTEAHQGEVAVSA